MRTYWHLRRATIPTLAVPGQARRYQRPGRVRQIYHLDRAGPVGSLVVAPGTNPDEAYERLLASLLARSDVYLTGYHAAYIGRMESAGVSG